MKKKTTSTIHDAAFKGFMTNIANARDFFEIHLPEHIKSLCDFNTLSLTNSSFIDKQLRSRLSDVLYSVRTSQGEGYIYLLVEHQSTPDKLMAWRLMHYAFLAMNQHMQQGNTTLPIVVPILFYHGGRSPYPYTQLWTECFPLPEIAHELYTQPFPLVDITVIDDNELVNHRKIAVMELAMKHKYLRVLSVLDPNQKKLVITMNYNSYSHANEFSFT
ncbi:Rpn family recombination-promoting nuclease/putative transposase [Providencia rettgeri]|nr:Rpn family recombination-promoting nuclease/putative transposase [Providencia rettgeri]MDE4733641.1 Rpn family recombination-promoting nuclease/putative transposase [Providencia rettgeri]